MNDRFLRDKSQGTCQGCGKENVVLTHKVGYWYCRSCEQAALEVKFPKEKK